MNSKKIVAALGLCALLVIIVYPALATGSVSVTLRAGAFTNADHVYVTVTDISAHKTGQAGDQGWELIENQSRTLDLASLSKSNSSSMLASGQIPASSYDMIRVDISNVSWVHGPNSTNLQLQSSLVQANVKFIMQAQKSVNITLTLAGQSVNVSGTEYFYPTLTALATEPEG